MINKIKELFQKYILRKNNELDEHNEFGDFENDEQSSSIVKSSSKSRDVVTLQNIFTVKNIAVLFLSLFVGFFLGLILFFPYQSIVTYVFDQVNANSKARIMFNRVNNTASTELHDINILYNNKAYPINGTTVISWTPVISPILQSFTIKNDYSDFNFEINTKFVTNFNVNAELKTSTLLWYLKKTNMMPMLALINAGENETLKIDGSIDLSPIDVNLDASSKNFTVITPYLTIKLSNVTLSAKSTNDTNIDVKLDADGKPDIHVAGKITVNPDDIAHSYIDLNLKSSYMGGIEQHLVGDFTRGVEVK